MLKNSIHAYGAISKAFHWLLAAAILGMLAFGLWMDGLPLSPDKFHYYGIHKSIGSLIIGAVVLRYLWRLFNKVPALSKSSWPERAAAHAVHMALYGLMLAIPLSGWLMSSASGFPVSVFDWFQLPNLIAANKEMAAQLNQAHGLLAYAIMALVALHVLAALKHHFINKDNILKRMLPWSGH